jgi:hypothetical protein
MQRYFKLLGFRVKDKITGFEGVVETIGFDLYGCVQASVRPTLTDKKEWPDGRWFDLIRLVPISKKPVIEMPAFMVEVMTQSNHPLGQPPDQGTGGKRDKGPADKSPLR